MKTKPYLWIILSFIGVLIVAFSFTIALAARAEDRVASQDSLTSPFNAPSMTENVGTAFTYQGRLMDGGYPANGTYDLRFKLFDALTGGSQLGSTINVADLAIADGIFTVQLDFGDVFDGTARWLHISVRPGASTGSYTTLIPRQELTPAPLALALPGLRTVQNATSPNLIGGYWENSVTSSVFGATIGGGGASGDTNRITDYFGTICGGAGNLAGDDDIWLDSAWLATVSGGANNTASGDSATVGGGWNNTASGASSTVSGGWYNTASSSSSTVCGGSFNHASGWYATIPGGDNNTASGKYSFAAGRSANAQFDGCFVWGDSKSGTISCAADDRWVVRSTGGVYFYSNVSPSNGVYLAAGGNSWNAISDRATKENFSAVDNQDILESLASIPLHEYNLRSQDPSIRHLGPVAQDFYAAFGYGVSDTAINMEDADGVAFAAIQGLYEILHEKDAQILELEARLSALEGQAPKNDPPTIQMSLFNWLVAGWMLIVSVVLVKRRFSGVRP